MSLLNRLGEYALLMRLDRPIGALLLLWPMLWALWIAAKGPPDISILFIFLIGVFVMRSAGCVINDYADRDPDPHVERTRQRPLAARRVRPREALGLFAALGLCALGLVAMTNQLTILLSIPGIVLAATYPYAKRFTYLPQVHLGLAFGWAVPMAYAAQTDALPALAWLIMTAAVLWAVVYDTQYAMVDRNDDLLVGVKSTAILFGDLDRVFVSGFQVLVLLSLLVVGLQADLGSYYYAALAIGTALFLYQMRLIWRREREGCFAAFLNNNWFGAVIFAGIYTDYAFGASL